jgi:hypothetical protein
MIINPDVQDLSELFQLFIGTGSDVLKYLHNTRSEEVAQNILKEGFIFEKYLENTTDLVSGIHLVEIKYFKQIRRSYGDYSIVIEISKKTVEEFSNRLNGTPYHFTEVLSKYKPLLSQDGEPVYTLPEQFVKGYFNQLVGIAVNNPVFDPYYISPSFEENYTYLIDKWKEEKKQGLIK